MLAISDYDYHLPPEQIAQTPAEPRDHSRLLVLDRATGSIQHRHFYDVLDYLRPGDLLVVNDSRVLPARLYGHKSSGGKTEALLLRQLDATRWEALLKGKMPVGTSIRFAPQQQPELHISATVEEVLPAGSRIINFEQPINQRLADFGVMPLPPYITAPLANPERYQTVYSAAEGSAAAPTAGLHWTPELIERVKQAGIQWASVTLHVGLDTFRPVQQEDALAHAMHHEWFELPAATAAAINSTRARGGRVVAVGTTTVRVLETVGQQQAQQPALEPAAGWTDIYIYPPYQFHVVDALITNFHLPRSTLLLLVSALADRETILHAYSTAVEHGYRFFSFGDAMLIM